MRIRMFDCVNLSPAWSHMADAVKDLQDSGLNAFAAGEAPGTDFVLIAFSNEKSCKPQDVMGFMTYYFTQNTSSWWINLSYTLPSYRRLGIHTALFNTLVERGRKRGDILAIENSTHYNNHVAQASFAKQGRQPSAIMYRYELQPFSSDKDPLHIEEK